MAAAFAVAAGLHLLIFQLWPQANALQLQTDQGSNLHVELVKNVVEQPSRAIETRKPSIPEKRIEQLVSEHATQPDEPQQFTQKQMVASPEEPASPPVEDTKVAYEAAPDPVPDGASSPGAMPADVQRMILTRISYPRQARLKGWQGRATFHLDVREQKLTRLDLTLSSGFALLDRAAMRGIRKVGRLPLANGLYSLPVEFRLQ